MTRIGAGSADVGNSPRSYIGQVSHAHVALVQRLDATSIGRAPDRERLMVRTRPDPAPARFSGSAAATPANTPKSIRLAVKLPATIIFVAIETSLNTLYASLLDTGEGRNTTVKSVVAL